MSVYERVAIEVSSLDVYVCCILCALCSICRHMLLLFGEKFLNMGKTNRARFPNSNGWRNERHTTQRTDEETINLTQCAETYKNVIQVIYMYHYLSVLCLYFKRL